MLGIGGSLSTSGGAMDNIPLRINFSKTRTLDASVDYFRIIARYVRHKINTTEDDDNPRVYIGGLTVKINGVVNTDFQLDSSNVQTSSHIKAAHVNATSMTFEDTTTTDGGGNAVGLSGVQGIYLDTSVSAGNAGDTIEVYGTVQVVANSSPENEYGGEYVPFSLTEAVNGAAAHLQFEFNNVSSTKDRIQVFIDPGTPVGRFDTDCDTCHSKTIVS